MKVFEIAYGSHEDSDKVFLRKETDMQEQDFYELIYKYSVEFLHHREKEIKLEAEQYLEIDNTYSQSYILKMGVDSWVREKLSEIRFDCEMLSFIEMKLITEQGFEKIIPDISFSVFSWCDIIGDSSFKTHRNEHLGKIKHKFLEQKG